jgi:hypothetical protein
MVVSAVTMAVSTGLRITSDDLRVDLGDLLKTVATLHSLRNSTDFRADVCLHNKAGLHTRARGLLAHESHQRAGLNTATLGSLQLMFSGSRVTPDVGACSESVRIVFCMLHLRDG